MLAGRKLLLADDSVTIQKVIELTFADEGVRVVAFGNGQDAIDSLEEIAPDIVLADVFMPEKNGYEVCEYVKQNEKLKAIPVMLLVGSFEPFDEAEARRVGADDILTKPFQSIRRLIDRVGALVSNPPLEKELPTAELKHNGSGENFHDEVTLDAERIETTTADTLPLPDEMNETLEFPAPVFEKEPEVHEEKMETRTVELNRDLQADSGDVLLDLGEIEHADVMDSDEFVLDLDDEFSSADVSEPAPMRAFVEPEVNETVATNVVAASSYQPEVHASAYAETEELAYEDQVHEIVPESKYDTNPIPQPIESEVVTAPLQSAVTPENLSPEMIDAIAKRVVEMMSEKVVQEIAWEVVPDLAELLIKKRLEEQESRTK